MNLKNRKTLLLFFKLFFVIIIKNNIVCDINFNHKVYYEQKLIDKLLPSYNNKLRPSGTVQVKFSFNINQIIDIVEKDQIMVINAFVDHKWIDERLAWGKFRIV
jgi:hypothetical protein